VKRLVNAVTGQLALTPKTYVKRPFLVIRLLGLIRRTACSLKHLSGTFGQYSRKHSVSYDSGMATIGLRVRFRWELILCLSLAVLMPAISRARELSQSPSVAMSVTGNTGNQGSVKQAAQPSSTATATAEESEDEYRDRITNYFYKQNYERLEKEAQKAQTTKARFPGGVWKLYVFYEALNAAGRSDKATEDDWMYYQYLVQEWVKQRPDSITAQIARAEAYLNYGWHARGRGYADTVTDEGWQLFHSRVALARHGLDIAAKLKEKSPYWYEAMQHVATAQGWSKSDARDLFEQAIAFEPTYYHYYREYAGYLLPKWHGENGEAEAFAEETAKRVPGREGLFLYFEVASVIACPCGGEDASEHLQNLSWPRIKQGYKAMAQLYGTSKLKRNRYASMAFAANDLATAQRMFTEIGEDWEPAVWETRANFETTKESVAKRTARRPSQATSLVGNSRSSSPD